MKFLQFTASMTTNKPGELKPIGKLIKVKDIHDITETSDSKARISTKDDIHHPPYYITEEPFSVIATRLK